MRKGFTLVELSIALVIIGLLIGGILIAQSMILATKTTRLVSDIQKYEVSFNNFYYTYKVLPGDSRLFSPPGAQNNALGYGDTNGDGIEDVTNCNGAYFNEEYTQVWAHLSQARMIDANYPRYSPNTMQPCPGGTQPFYSQLEGNIVPYTEVDGKIGGGQKKYGILGGKYTSESNFFLTLVVTKEHVLPMESKMSSSQTDNFLGNQIGLANGSGAGRCYDEGTLSYMSCTSAAADGTYFNYYMKF